jgi:hypothetical protein
VYGCESRPVAVSRHWEQVFKYHNIAIHSSLLVGSGVVSFWKGMQKLWSVQNLYLCMYIGFKTFFYVVRHLDSIASYLPTGLHLGFFRAWPSLFLPSSFSSVFLVLTFVLASTSVLFWAIFLLPFFGTKFTCLKWTYRRFWRIEWLGKRFTNSACFYFRRDCNFILSLILNILSNFRLYVILIYSFFFLVEGDEHSSIFSDSLPRPTS